MIFPIKQLLLFFILITLNSFAQQSADKVIFLTDNYLNYIDKIRFNGKEAENIYKAEILDKLFMTHFQKSEFADIVKESFIMPIKNTTELQKSIDGIFYKKAHIIAKVVEVSTRCRQKLDNTGLTIYILPADPDNKLLMNRMSGIMGLTAGSKQILITIDPTCDNWEAMFEYTLAREFNKAYWLSANTDREKKWTLLDYMMFEGKADSFAHFLYPNIKVPWTRSLSEVQKKEIWNKIKPELESQNVTYQKEVMFGSAEFPSWAGYSLGYAIIQSAFQNDLNLLRQKWTDIPAKEILEMSSYKLVIGKK